MGYRSNVGYLVMVGDNNGKNKEEAEKLFHMLVNEAKASDDTKEMFKDLESKGDIQLKIDEDNSGYRRQRQPQRATPSRLCPEVRGFV